jgi:hypothetical protein
LEGHRAHTVEMHIFWAPAPPRKATVNPDAVMLRWVKDGETAKRVKE